jgi:hypothetical protein
MQVADRYGLQYRSGSGFDEDIGEIGTGHNELSFSFCPELERGGRTPTKSVHEG